MAVFQQITRSSSAHRQLVVWLLLAAVVALSGCGGGKKNLDAKRSWSDTNAIWEMVAMAREQEPPDRLPEPLAFGVAKLEDIEKFLDKLPERPEDLEKSEELDGTEYVEADYGEYRIVYRFRDDGSLRSVSAVARAQKSALGPERVLRSMQDQWGPENLSETFRFELDGEEVETDLTDRIWNRPEFRVTYRVPYDNERDLIYLVVRLEQNNTENGAKV